MILRFYFINKLKLKKIIENMGGCLSGDSSTAFALGAVKGAGLAAVGTGMAVVSNEYIIHSKRPDHDMSDLRPNYSEVGRSQRNDRAFENRRQSKSPDKRRVNIDERSKVCNFFFYTNRKRHLMNPMQTSYHAGCALYRPRYKYSRRIFRA